MPRARNQTLDGVHMHTPCCTASVPLDAARRCRRSAMAGASAPARAAQFEPVSEISPRLFADLRDA